MPVVWRLPSWCEPFFFSLFHTGPGAAGKDATTHYTVAEAFPKSSCAFLRLVLETGRTHQIRVHCSGGLGLPLLGDSVYGGGIGKRHLPSARLLRPSACHTKPSHACVCAVRVPILCFHSHVELTLLLLGNTFNFLFL